MDYIVRATAADSQIRAFAATTKETVELARQYHNTSPVATAALGRLLTAGAMMGAMMKGEKDLLTLQIKGNGPLGGITVTADSAANVKGYVNNPEVLIHANEQGKLDVGGAVGAGILNVIRDMGLKEPYVGQCELQTGEIGVGRVITGGKVYQNKFSSEKTEKDGSPLLRCKIQGSLQGTFVIGEKARIENAWIISGVRNTTIQAKVSSTEKAQPGRVSLIRLNWTKSKGFKVDGYEIYHSFDDSYYQKAYTLEGSDCYNRNVTSGTTKYYKIRGYRNVNGQICYTRWSNVISGSV